MKCILLVEDDKDLNRGLTYDLGAEGYQVVSAFTAGEALAVLNAMPIDLVLLDGNLPDGDGFDLCRGIKSERDIPIVFLTARDMDQDEMQGFDCGADDYITKPFKMPILHRRIAAALRKYGGQTAAPMYDDGYLKIDFDQLSASRNGEAITLTPTELKLMRLLMANRDKVMTKQLLLEKVWDTAGNFVDEHTVAVNINRLRKKIEDENHVYIKTLYGMGYQWKGRG